MNEEYKLKCCIVPSNEIRYVERLHNSPTEVKVQQKNYNYDGTAFVWRDVKIKVLTSADFSKSVLFD